VIGCLPSKLFRLENEAFYSKKGVNFVRISDDATCDEYAQILTLVEVLIKNVFLRPI